MKENSYFVCVLSLLLCTLISGCVGLNGFPNAARAGDTVTLALGSIEGLDKATISVMYVSDSDPLNPIDITSGVTEIFKVYPDQTSYAWLLSQATAIAGRSTHGPWLSAMTINLPLGLPVNTGHVEITSNAGASFPRFTTPPDAIDIQLEILPGPGGSPNPFEYATFSGATELGNLRRLTGRPQVVVKPPLLPEGSQYAVSYGAVEIDLNIPITSLDGSPVVDEGIVVVLDPQPDHIFRQTQMFWSRVNDDFRISIISPIGLYQHEIRVSIVPLYPTYPYVISDTPTPNLTGIQYYDIDGIPTTGETPLLVVEN